MNFELDEFQTLLKESAARFLSREYDSLKRRETIAAGCFSQERWEAFAELGWLGVGIPEAAGGLGMGPVETAILAEEFGRRLVVEPILPVAVLARAAIVALADPRSAQMLEEIALGTSRPVLAHSEPSAFGNPAWVETQAVEHREGWVLNGRKSLVLGGPFASIFLVSARTAKASDDSDGISVFIVAPDAPGLRRTDVRLADNSMASELQLDSVHVGASASLGPLGEALPAIDLAIAEMVAALCSEAIGAMEASLWITRDYLKTRHQFGRAIGEFQALQHRMADMVMQLELARSITYRLLAHLQSDPIDTAFAVSAAKVQLEKSAKFVGGQSIQLHGGIGVTDEHDIGHYFKRLMMICNLFGPATFHLDRMGQIDKILRESARNS